MEIEVRGRTIKLSRWLEAYAERAVSFALDRFEKHFQRVRVLITDLNGPRKGLDRRCTIIVNAKGRRSLVARRTDSTIRAAIDGAAERAGRLLRSALGRMSRRQRGRARRDVSYWKLPAPTSGNLQED